MASRRNSVLKHAFEHSTDAVVLTDDRGGIVYFNDKAKRFFAAETCRTIDDVLHPRVENVGSLTLRMTALAKSQKRVFETIVSNDIYFEIILTHFGAQKYLWCIRRKDIAAYLPTVAPPDHSVADIGQAVGHIGQNTAGHHHNPHNPNMGNLGGEDGTTSRDNSLSIAPQGRALDNMFNTLQPKDAEKFFENMPIALLKVSSDGVILTFNAMAKNIFGHHLKKRLPLNKLFYSHSSNPLEWLRSVVSNSNENSTEFFHLFGQDQEAYFQLQLCPVDEDFADDSILAVTDVTKIKSLEAQFVQSQKMQAIGQLAGGVAHDFNNLLTAISGHCDLLLLRHDEHDASFSDLVQIHQNANRAAALVGQLLAFSRKQNFRSEKLELKSTLSDLAHLLSRLVGEQIELTLSHEFDKGWIFVDKRQLEQILMNLVVNARDAIDGQGDVKISTEMVEFTDPSERDNVVIPAGQYMSIKVSDEGKGIRPDLLRKIFEPFFTTKGTGEGTGLGLSTVYGIVKQSNGFIFVDSVVGQGTTFDILFPRVEGTDHPKHLHTNGIETLTHADKGGTVLLVEDEAPVRTFASRALKLKGFDVVEADCGEAALECLNNKSLNIDVFVTDVIMPGMDGPTWVHKARKDFPDTKVVFVSGYAEDSFEDKQSLIQNSVFLQKPFSLTALTDTVSKMMD